MGYLPYFLWTECKFYGSLRGVGVLAKYAKLRLYFPEGPPRWGGSAVGEACGPPKPPLLTRGASPPGSPDLHSEGTEALELTIQAEAQEPDL